MNSAKLNPRIKEIPLQLAKAAAPITLSEIAKNLEVSAKTIRRDLPYVEKILCEYGFKLDKKTGVGIHLLASSAEKNQLIQLFQEQTTQQIYTPTQRQIAIAGQLLSNQEPMKLFKLTKQLNVTESTISNDLDKLEPWFAKHHLSFIRKPGLGIYLQGDEQDIRKAIIHYIYENIDETALLSILRDNFSKAKENHSSIAIDASRQLLNLVEPSVIIKLTNLLKDTEEFMSKKLSDSAYIGLTVHLALAIKRMQTYGSITMTQSHLTELQQEAEYRIAQKIATQINNVFHLTVPEAEIGYITMHLLGARNQYFSAENRGKTIDNFKLVQLSTQMIKIAEQEIKLPLIKNEKLLIGLVNHLGPSIRRLQMNMEIRNPLLKDMKEHYPELMWISKKCAITLEDKLDLIMPEAEIAYIAMHLGAAIESQHKVFKPIYKIAIACPSGMGSSRLLATRIEREYETLKITNIISAIRIDETELRRASVDFVISTIPITNCTLPVIVVNSLLLDVDKLAIENQINLLNTSHQTLSKISEQNYTFSEKITMLTDYGQAILELLNNFFLTVDASANSLETVIINISKFLKSNGSEQKILEKAFLARERYGTTFISDSPIILLHCRNDIITQLCFGVIQLANQITVNDGNDEMKVVKTIVVMLAPEEVSKTKLEIMSYLAKMFLERFGFLDLLQSGPQERIRLEISNMLEEFYKERNTTFMEG